MTVTDADNGASVTLSAGEQLTVRLAENPTTGYRWRAEPWDGSLLELTGDEYQAPGDARPGAAGEHEWHFVARRPGGGSLRLAYRRAWGDADPAKVFSLNVAVG